MRAPTTQPRSAPPRPASPPPASALPPLLLPPLLPLSFPQVIALDHIHEGVCTFEVVQTGGAAGLAEMRCQNARLVLDEDGLIFTNDISEGGLAGSSAGSEVHRC